MSIRAPSHPHPVSGRLLRELTGAEDSSLARVLRARVFATPDAAFLHWAGRDHTYAEALDAAERFAAWLHQQRLWERGGRVATYLPNRPEALWSWFGTALAGMVCVPLNREHRGDLLADMLARSGACLVVTDAGGAGELPPGTRTLVVDSAEGWSQVAACPPWAGVDSEPDAIATVLYTSGSTGRSKAVLMPANRHARGPALIAEALGLSADDRWHCWAPHFHVYAQVYPIAASIVAGGSVALEARFSRSRHWRQVEASRSTIIGGMANVMRRVWQHDDGGGARAARVRLALVSGDFADLRTAFEQRYGLTVVDCFGMTEAEPVTLPDPERPVGHGRPSPDIELTILDEHDRPLPAGRAGEIAFRPRRPDVTFAGYEHDDEATAAAWRGGWFHTGDLGRLDAEGHLHFLDKRKHGIRRLGENVSPVELERVVMAHPLVAQAVVLGIPDRPGEDEIKVVYTLDGDGGLEPSELVEWLRPRVARFMVPRYVERAERLPLLTLGKIDRARLAYVDGRVWDGGAP